MSELEKRRREYDRDEREIRIKEVAQRKKEIEYKEREKRKREVEDEEREIRAKEAAIYKKSLSVMATAGAGEARPQQSSSRPILRGRCFPFTNTVSGRSCHRLLIFLGKQTLPLCNFNP